MRIWLSRAHSAGFFSASSVQLTWDHLSAKARCSAGPACCHHCAAWSTTALARWTSSAARARIVRRLARLLVDELDPLLLVLLQHRPQFGRHGIPGRLVLGAPEFRARRYPRPALRLRRPLRAPSPSTRLLVGFGNSRVVAIAAIGGGVGIARRACPLHQRLWRGPHQRDGPGDIATRSSGWTQSLRPCRPSFCCSRRSFSRASAS